MSSSTGRDILDRALSFGTADHLTLSLSESTELATRIANSTITQNLSRRRRTLTVTAAFGDRVGSASSDDFSDDGIRAVVHRAEEIARASSPDPEFVPPPEPPDSYPETATYCPATREFTVDQVATHVVDAIRRADKEGLGLAGSFSTAYGSHAILNSRGLFHETESTWAQYTNTAMTDTSSGWATCASRDVSELDIAGTAERAIQKAISAANPRDVAPGAYTVILEPDAAHQFLSGFYGVLDAKAAHEGRSCLSGKEGTRIGGENVTISSIPDHSECPGSPTIEAGLPAPTVRWIDGGVLTNLRYSRYWAQKSAHAVTQPVNFIMKGGKASLDELIGSTERGILVTRFWYIRYVDPMTFLLTGMTRDGLFWIEDGEIRHGIRNLRFNESPLRVFNQIEGMTPATRVGALALMPALKVTSFRFTSGTSF